MLTIIQYPLETGIVIALLVYGLEPAGAPEMAASGRRAPYIPRSDPPGSTAPAGACRARHPLSLGLVADILTGTLVPVLLISMYALFSALVVGVILLLAFRYGDWKEEPEEEHALYHSYDSEEPIVSSNHPSAIKDWPASLL